ncbi:MAG: hypothetical protein M3070_08860 [Actinomycetota bacterium]|nr:hypothetical protein [Actinomycetota bacterium]
MAAQPFADERAALKERTVGAGFAVLQTIAAFFLPNIKPGQALEDVAT